MEKKTNLGLFQRLITPSAPVADAVQLLRAKLLSILVLTFTFSAQLYGVLQYLIEPSFLPVFLLICGNNIIFFIAFLLNRFGRHQAAGILAPATLAVVLLVIVFIDPVMADVRHLYVLVLPMLLGGMLLSIRHTLYLALFILAGVIPLIAVVPEITFQSALSPLSLFITLTALILGTMHYRDMVETQRRRKLFEKEEQYRSLVENINEVIFSLDLEGRFTFVSPVVSQVTGYTPGEMIGKEFSRYVHPDDLQDVQSSLQKLYGGTHEVTDFRFMDKDGGTLRLRTSSHLLLENDQPVGVTGVVTDVTEQTALREQLNQAQKMESVGRLAGGIAHDFNNMLTIILGYCHLLLDDDNLDASVAESVNHIRTAADRTSALTRQLLAFSRKQVIEPQILNLNRRIEDMLPMLQRLLGERVILDVFPADPIPPIKADPAQVEQVIMNLAVNAVDAMPEGGTLTIRTTVTRMEDSRCSRHVEIQPGDGIELSVTDTGCGMNAETQKHLFEPFYTTKEPGKGTGLGLSTVYGIVKQSGGYTCVESEPGRGTTFYIHLPAASEAGTPVPAVSGGADDPQPEKGSETILVVEDEPELRDVVLEGLSAFGYRAHAAGTGEEACERWERMEGETPHLLITDLVMPGMNGKELADRMVNRYPHLNVLYISGYTKTDILDPEKLEAGRFFMSKPFTPRKLARRVREILDGD